jgi:sigma-B regulation protein RsbU (phosphoserine phosphatase)
MQPGDIFALISDGFFEYCDQKGEQFGKDRIEDLIRAHRQEPLEELRENLCTGVKDFAAGGSQEDDMTILLTRRNFQ